MSEDHADRGDPTPSIAQHSSKSNEHYTPTPITSVARLTLGAIDFDPASCPIANRETVKARVFWTSAALEQKWGLQAPFERPRVFCNPPGGFVPGTRKSQAQAFYFKAVQEWMANRIEACVFLGFTLELLRLSQGNPVLPGASRFSFCIPRERTDFLVQFECNECKKRTATAGPCPVKKCPGIAIETDTLKPEGAPSHANVLILISDDAKMIERFENYADVNLGDVVTPRSRARRIQAVT